MVIWRSARSSNLRQERLNNWPKTQLLKSMVGATAADGHFILNFDQLMTKIVRYDHAARAIRFLKTGELGWPRNLVVGEVQQAHVLQRCVAILTHI